LQERLAALNADWRGAADAIAPDGDADLEAAALAGFVVADCVACGGVLKPDVVFFGDNVARPVLDDAWRLFDEAELLLVVGSSLTVWSGYRFVRRAAERGLPVAIVNLGPTRGDALATLRLDAPLGTVLPQLAAALA
jgi:NAD-dependent SIR2 family protein deacetylase